MQITPRRLSLDLSSLWSLPEERFVLRYQDISESKQIKLAQRIKQASSIYTLTTERGPSPEVIKEILLEINPIIFAESRLGSSTGYYHNRTQRTFNIYAIRTISGWLFKKLCRAIYYIACRRRPLNRHEMKTIIDLTNNSNEEGMRLLETIFPNGNQEQETETVSEISMEDIEHARMNLPIP